MATESIAETWTTKVQEGFRSLVRDTNCASSRRGTPSKDPGLSHPEVTLADDWPSFLSHSSGLSGSTITARSQPPADEPGLQNARGSNHCFLNAVVQALWNLQSFRQRILLALDHVHGDGTMEEIDSCCFCSLQSLFNRMQLAEGAGGSIPPDDLRRALSRVYNVRGRFRLGEMEDATETIEALLGVLHACNVEATSGTRSPGQDPSEGSRSRSSSAVDHVEEASNFGCHPLCIAHEVFGVEYVDLPRCSFCGATGEPGVSSAFLYCAYVADLVALAEAASPAAAWPMGSPTPSRRLVLQDLLRSLCQRQVPQKCTECNSLNTVCMERWLTRQPLTFLISLVWPSSYPSRQTQWMVLSMIRPELRLNEIFRVEGRGRQAPRTRIGLPAPADAVEADLEAYAFRGLVCYSGMHYVALFWCWAKMKWILFDDTCVREEQDWTSVTNFIMGGKYVPTLIFYERRDHGSPDGFGLSDASVRELERQMAELEDRQQQACSAM